MSSAYKRKEESVTSEDALATKKICKYFPGSPTENHIHGIFEPPVPTVASSPQNKEIRKSTKKDSVNYIRTQWVSEDFDAEDLKSTNISQPSTIVSPKSTFVEKFLEKRRERRIANEVPIDDISSIPEKYMKLLEVEIFREPNVSESIPQDLWHVSIRFLILEKNSDIILDVCGLK
ncbi:9864_t:CDS:2 [Ambispora leptoticha]|uniref:9864_t:CDS:1 n=1 Tax=Ambispora leptoticha TaxID=144679 RepID=A0A9N9BYM7_9GLOM|nr:9864_t:CDS:2 [Ambispora leptoticha]